MNEVEKKVTDEGTDSIHNQNHSYQPPSLFKHHHRVHMHKLREAVTRPLDFCFVVVVDILQLQCMPQHQLPIAQKDTANTSPAHHRVGNITTRSRLATSGGERH